jgi:hypothetical protein
LNGMIIQQNGRQSRPFCFCRYLGFQPSIQ